VVQFDQSVLNPPYTGLPGRLTLLYPPYTAVRGTTPYTAVPPC